MTQKNHSPQDYLPGLDGLRAIACLMVFAVHFSQITRLRGNWGPFDLARLFENGNTGVALFFALSGFLLSLSYWKALESGGSYPPTVRYLVRRAMRILPAYFACLTILIVLNRFWLKADRVRDIVLHYTLTFNYLDATIFRINPPFWTLAVEAQFYLLLPLFFLLARRLSLRAALVQMLAIGAAAYVGHLLIMTAAADTLVQQAGAHPRRGVSHVLTYSLLAHLPHFLMGMVTGGIFVARQHRTQVVPRHFSAGRETTLWLAVFALFVILGTAVDDTLRIPYGRYNLPYVPVLLCLVILLTPASVSARALLDSWPLRWIGAISYGIYIYHLPVLNAVQRYMGYGAVDAREHWFVYGAASLILTLAIAACSYWLLERPILNFVKAKA